MSQLWRARAGLGFQVLCVLILSLQLSPLSLWLPAPPSQTWCILQGCNSSTDREVAASWTRALHTETTNPSKSSTPFHQNTDSSLPSSCRMHDRIIHPVLGSHGSFSQEIPELSPFSAGLSSAVIAEGLGAVGFKIWASWQSWCQPWFGSELSEALKQEPAQNTKPGTVTALLGQHNKPSPWQHLGQEVLQLHLQHCCSQGCTKGSAALPFCSQLPALEQLECEWKLSRLTCQLI